MDSLGEESIKFSKKDMMFKDFDIFRAGVLFTKNFPIYGHCMNIHLTQIKAISLTQTQLEINKK